MPVTHDDDSETSHLIANLAQKAIGEIEILTLKAPKGVSGIPDEIPVGYRTGEKAEFIGLATYFEPWRTGPERRTGTAKAATLASFVDLVNRHKDEDSVIFAAAQWPGPKLTAVIDYHKQDKTSRFGRHRIEYAFPVSPEFAAWIKSDNTPMPQLEFAQFLEEHAAELAEPTSDEAALFVGVFKERFGSPNELIGLSRSLELYVGMSIKSQLRLKTGDRTVQFESKTTNNAEGGEVDIPGIFMISLPAFVDGAPVRIPARLRLIPGQEVKWKYQLYRWQEWLRLRVQEDLDVASKLTTLPAFEGTPEI